MSGAAVGTRLQPIADRPAYADVRSSRAHTSHGVARHQLPAVAKHTQCLQSSLRAPAWTCSERAFAVLGRHIRPAATPSNSCQQPDQALMCPYALQQRAEPWTHLQVTGRCLGRCSTLNLSSKPQHLRHQRLQLAAQRRGRAGQQALLLHHHAHCPPRPAARQAAWCRLRRLVGARRAASGSRVRSGRQAYRAARWEASARLDIACAD